MEGLKDVIVSQPPAMYTASSSTAAAATTTTMGIITSSSQSHSISLENYKGILLCDRPVVSMYCGSTGYSAGGGGDGGAAPPFVPANRTGNPLGAAPSMEQRALREQHQRMRDDNHKSHRDRSRQVLSRHRRWLHSFAQQVRRMRADERDREVAAAQQAARLRAAELQRIAESNRRAETKDATAAAVTTTMADAVVPPAAATAAATAPAPAPNKDTAATTRTTRTSRKPKWAMTEDEALDAELTQHDDLVNFAEQLDYDRFLTECDVAEALGAMRDRVHAVARAHDWTDEDVQRAARQRRAAASADGNSDSDEVQSTVSTTTTTRQERQQQQQQLARRAASDDGTSAATAAAAAAAEHAHEWDSSTHCGRVLRRAISGDALALAERLLAASPSLQRVYTRQSLARVVQQCVLRGSTTLPSDIASAAAAAASRSDAREPSATAAGRDKSSGDDGVQAVLVGPLVPAQPRVMPVSATAMATCKGADVTDGTAATATTPPPAAAPQRVLCAMQRSVERTQGLPYLYRCPAI